MGEVSALDRYRAYLLSVDKATERDLTEEEYLDLLAPSEVVDLLCARDDLADAQLDAADQRELMRLDDLLVKHRRVVVENIVAHPEEPRTRWWWHLQEGPRAREEAEAA